MHGAVDHRRGHDFIAEHVAPAGEGQVGGRDQRGVFVAAGDQLEEQVRRVLLEGAPLCVKQLLNAVGRCPSDLRVFDGRPWSQFVVSGIA